MEFPFFSDMGDMKKSEVIDDWMVGMIVSRIFFRILLIGGLKK